MNFKPILNGGRQLHFADGQAGMRVVRIDGESFVEIENLEAMDDFFIALAGDSDLWCFIDSKGLASAGRGSPERALFPYLAVDQIMAGAGGGGRRLLLVSVPGGSELWEPLRPGPAPRPRRRSLAKHACGSQLRFEEVDEDLQLVWRETWGSCQQFGLVRRSKVVNLGRQPRRLRIVDGFEYLLPAGAAPNLENRRSYLAHAYMRHEREPESGLGIYTMNAEMSDRAEPREALRCTVAWSAGLEAEVSLLSCRQLAILARGAATVAEDEVRGCPGAHLQVADRELAAGESLSWITVADTWLDHAGVERLQRQLLNREQLAERTWQAVREDTAMLEQRLDAADARQDSGLATAVIHHRANVLFNCLRGGVFADGHSLQTRDFQDFLMIRNRPLAERHQALLDILAPRIERQSLLAACQAAGDPHLQRLARCYLPLVFSRRHGDPSRPWNNFSINLRHPNGDLRCDYQGNWRDIFQNWEALCHSFPAWTEAATATFLDASSPDGYNPFRISRAGFDWEVENPEDPWSFIGYWGDHQIVYLTRLLALRESVEPGGLSKALAQLDHVYADIPYRIRAYREILRNPRDTIEFDARQDRKLRQRLGEIGGDGGLRQNNDAPRRVSLAEKLLLPVLTKLSNLVPGGGVWLNTQRPEWNDANNALVGWGLSMVTACQLRQHLQLLRSLFTGGPESLPLHRAVAELLRKVADILPATRNAVADPESRKSVMDALGLAGEAHRMAVYADRFGPVETVAREKILDLLTAAGEAIGHTINANRRPDGLYHSYNLLRLEADSAHIDRLPLMLEGQTAVVASGHLDPGATSRLLDCLARSPLYCPRRRSYLLYPDRKLTPWRQRNCLPRALAEANPLLRAELQKPDGAVVAGEDPKTVHFAADIVNRQALRARLAAADGEPALEQAMQLHEEVFKHAAFTGRSTTFFAFEGLGSIYWHMVAKLLLAVQEQHRVAVDAGDSAAADLARHYRTVRAGLGWRKPPGEWGAFPTDPYSHTPAHAGAQQPGMTGQVKEEILSRKGELGVRYLDGKVSFAPLLLEEQEFDTRPRQLEWRGPDGRERLLDLPANSLVFGCCQTPVVYRPGTTARISVAMRSGEVRKIDGNTLGRALSRELLSRSGRLDWIEVQLS